MIKKAAIILLCAFLVGFFVASPTKAADFIGQFCWNLEGFLDVLKLSVSRGQGSQQFELHGSLAAAGYYELTFAGNAFIGESGQIVIGGFLSHDGSSFGGATGLSLHGTLDGSRTGPIVANGLDQPFRGVPVTIVPIPCPPGPAEAKGTGRAFGE